MNAGGPVAPAARARHTCPKTSAIKVVRGGVVGLSGAMARAKYFLRAYSQPGIQSVEQRPSWLPSLQIMRFSDAPAFTERVSCCAASEGLIEEGKGRTEMREMSLSPRCLYAR